jgi:ribosomal protein S18 acetylase RimI-like enzyme
VTAIRDAGVEDARALAELHVRSWRAAYRGFIADAVLRSLSVEDREAMWSELLSAERSDSFTLLLPGAAGTLAGFCSIALPSRDSDAESDTAEVAAIHIAPASCRRGVGSDLLTASIERLRDGPWHSVTAWVFADNANARAFFWRRGFVIDGSEKVYAEHGGATEIRLRRALTLPAG